jgi:hypothetical protein
MILPTRAKLNWVLFLFFAIPRSVLGEWLEVGSVVSSDGQRKGDFGSAVALSDTTMVVGDPVYNNGGNGLGRAYVYSLVNSSIVEEVQVLDAGEYALDFGYAVDIDGDTIVIGAYGSNEAFVFVKDGVGGWSLQAKLTPSVADGDFGFAVAVDGDRIVVGARHLNRYGKAFVFERNDMSWSETQLLENGAIDGLFGSALDLEEDTLVVGAYGRNQSKGAVYVFAFNDVNGEWDETHFIEASDADYDHQFGYSVALSGSRILVGATNEAKAYVYTGPGFEETVVLQGDAAGDDGFGYSVALFENTVVVGAPLHDSENGATYVFRAEGNSWSQATELTSSESAGEKLGGAVAISGLVVVAGAIQSDIAEPLHAGAVYVFLGEEEEDDDDGNDDDTDDDTDDDDKNCGFLFPIGCK